MQSLINNLITIFRIKIAKIVWISKISWSVQDKLDREALDGNFGFFQVAYESMVYFDSQHIYFRSELTFCTTVLVHYVLLYVVVPQESLVRDGWDLFKWAPTSRLRLITFCYTWWYRMAVMEGWMGPNPKGTHRRVCVSPRFAIRGHFTL
jgi:hypothetical protein